MSLAAQGKKPPPPDRGAALWRERQEWFYQQRAYPLGFIPAGARLRALQQLDRMLEEERKRRGQSGVTPLRARDSAVAASTTQWTEIGPRPTNGPFTDSPSAGRITALAVDPRNASVVYLGAAQGGVWKTTDGGTNWSPLTDTQATLAVGSLALDPSNPDIVYVGTGEENFSSDSYYGAGVLKSTNAGSAWTQLGASVFVGPFHSGNLGGGAFIGAMAVHPTNGQILLAAVRIFDNGSTPGVYRSTDGGTTWNTVLSNAPATAVLFDPTNGNIAYAALWDRVAATLSGVYKSADAGATWARADASGTNKLPTTNVGRIALAMAPSSTSTLYAGIANSSNGALLGLYKSTDGGANWAQLTGIPDYCTNQCSYDNVVAVHPTNANVVFAGGSAQNGTLFRSLDGGTTWTEISSGANGVDLHVDHHALAFSATGTKLYVGNDGGVWSTTDVTATSVNWTNLNGTLGVTQFYPGLSIHPTDVNISLGGTQDTGTQKYTGSLGWNYATCGDGAWTAIDFATPTTVYGNCQRIDIRKSTSSGAYGSWLQVMNGINTGDRVQFIPPLVMDPSNSSRLYFGTYRIWQTTDGAANWTAISPDLTGGSARVTTIAVAPSNANTVYAGTGDPKVQVTTNALAGASATWTNVSTGLPPRFITQIAVDPASSTTAYVTFSGFSGFGGDTKGHVFKTSNGGTSWTDISGNLPNIPVNDLVVDPDLANTLYVATDIGVFRTTDAGATWSTLVTGLPRVAVLSLKLHRGSRILRAATHGRSAWDLSVPPPTSALNLSPISLNFGSQPVGVTTAGQAVAISNGGSGSVTLGIAITGDFAKTTTCGSSLAAGASCTVTVTFTPTTTGTRTGSVAVNDGSLNSPQLVRLFGTGTSGPLGPRVSLSNLGLNFGVQATNTTSGAKSVTLTNSGDATLTVTSVSSTGDFAQTNNCGSVAAGGACTINVTFTPTTTGARSGSVRIVDNASGSPHVIRLFGAGDPGSAPAISFSSVSANFGNQANSTTSAAKSVTVTNSGSATLNITSVAASGDFAASGCVTSLAPGASCTISVTFTPTATGRRTGRVAVTDNASGSPQVIRLFGNGT